MTKDEKTTWNALKPTPKYAVRLQWSQTDWETVLIHATSAEAAEKRAKEVFPGIHHVSGVTLLTKEIK